MVHWTVGFQLFWFTKICHELISQREILNLPSCWRVGKGFVWAHSEQSIKDFWSWYKRANVAKKKPPRITQNTGTAVCTLLCLPWKRHMWCFKNVCHFICLVVKKRRCSGYVGYYFVSSVWFLWAGTKVQNKLFFTKDSFSKFPCIMVGAVMQGLFLGARSRLFSGEEKSTYSSVSAPKQPWNFSEQDFVLYYVFF